MPTIRKRNGQWQVQVRLTGCGPLSKTFDQYADAKAWGLEQERKLKLGDIPTERRKELQSVLLGGVIEWYRGDRAANVHKRKRSYANEEIALQAFQNRESSLCRKSLAELRQKDFLDYIDRRLRSGVKAATVRRELNPIRHIFKVARLERELPMPDLFRGLPLPAEDPGRDRILTQKEQHKLFRATEKCRGLKKKHLWFSLILAALQTALRRGELLKLQWPDIDFEKRTLRVRAENTKTKKGRVLPMSRGLSFHLWLYRSRVSEDRRAPDNRVFPITPTAHSQAWKRITKRAGLQDLHFHDLRHTAATCFDELDISNAQVRYLLGHGSRNTTDRYVHGLIEGIRMKLDVGQEGIELPKSDAELEEIVDYLIAPDVSENRRGNNNPPKQNSGST
jgi:integrase